MLPIAAWIPIMACLVGGGDWEEDELFDLSLEELLDIEVTTVSRVSQPLGETAAAVHVITREDIRRSGLRSVPELLRTVPGVQVARIGTNSWAISVRGFNGRFSNKLLVMIDGRTVYSDLFSGVFWHTLDTLLEDIERIEVIRGPGGTLWGANAVNGIIHIITRNAKDTAGSYGFLSAGDERRGEVGLRHGGELGEAGHWRLYTKWFEDDASQLPSGGDASDPHHQWRSGIRADWDLSDRDELMIQVDAFASRAREVNPLLRPTPPYLDLVKGTSHREGGNILGRWNRDLGERSSLQLQGFYEVSDYALPFLIEHRDTVELDFQHGFGLGSHQILWGATLRHIDSDIQGSPGITFAERHRTDHRFGVFLQDSVEMIEDQLDLTIGAKLDNTVFAGSELLPSLRLRWRPTEHSTWWAAVSRAVRTPSVINNDIRLNAGVVPGTPTTLVQLQGNPDLEAEELIAYEVGYRTEVSENFSIDITAFYFDYRNLQTQEFGTPFFDGTNTILPRTFENLGEAYSYGAELEATSRINPNWTITGSVSLLELEFDKHASSNDTEIETAGQIAPSFQAQLRSRANLSETVDFDIGIYAVEGLSEFDVDGYLRGDARLAWRPREGLELAFVLQNFGDSAHQEFDEAFLSTVSEIERSIYFSVAWRP